MIADIEYNFKGVLLKRVFFVIVAIVFLIFILVTYFTALERNLKDKIYPNVIVNGVDFGGKSYDDVYNFFAKKNKKYESIKIEVLFEGSKVATFSGKTIKLGYNAKDIADKSFLIGRSSKLRSRVYQKLVLITGLKKIALNEGLNYNRDILSNFLKEMNTLYNREPRNALFEFKNGRVTAFKEHRNGEMIDVPSFMRDFDGKCRATALEGKKNAVIVLRKKIIKPEVTLESSNNLGIKELVGVGKSDFSHSISARIYNIMLASSKFNGVLIPKDSIFSFNKTVGDISAHTGYKQSYVIKNGKTVLGDGGGVCQVSTTLFRAALNAGLPIIERHSHAYRVYYYENDSPPGFDATVFSPSVDLKFKNDTGNNLLIQVKVDKPKNLLYFYLYGTKDGRKVEISKPVIYGIEPPPEPLYQDDPNLPKGVVKQIDFASYGTKVHFDYKVTKGDKILFQKRFYSNFRPWQAVYLVGTGGV